MPIGLAMHDHGCRFGSGMYRALLSGRIALNVHIDMGRDPGQNMRIYEALGIGSFLLTEESDQLREHFTPGLHLDTYKTPEELIDKIYYYLAHDKEREEIAAAGQNRCLETCNLLSRASMLNDIILEEMQRPPKSRWNRMLSGIFGSRN
jgi:spore maturation protein CgeB